MTILHGEVSPGVFAPFQVDATGALVTSNRVLARSATGVSGAADTNENTLATISVPANALGPNGFIRLTLAWTLTNNANSKTLRVRYSGGAGTDFLGHNAASVGAVVHTIVIGNRNSASSQVGSRQAMSTAAAALIGAHVTASVDTTAATSIVITAQKGTAGDTVTLESYLAEIFYGA